MISQNIGPQHPNRYQEQVPFPHAVIDNFIDQTIARHVAAELLSLSQTKDAWWRFNGADEHNDQVKKRGLSDINNMPPLLRMTSDYFNSAVFIDFLESLTGIHHLLPDPTYNGGGYHQTSSGGKLGIHHDFNVHAIDGQTVFRRINLLVYMNPEWDNAWGGQLELWDKQLSDCVKRVDPVFNRAVIFTIDDAPHGHPSPLQCPQDTTRRSLAYYYYTVAEPETERRLTRAHWKHGNQLL